MNLFLKVGLMIIICVLLVISLMIYEEREKKCIE